MKRLFKVILILAIILVVGIGGVYAYLVFFLPDIDAPKDLKVEITPAKVERGRYLANELMGCVGCHAVRDYSLFAGPIIEETKGSGGEHWDHSLGFPGDLYAPNITPTYLKDWTDGEIYRAITSGVDKDGNALFPIMPYEKYGHLPKEDIYAVIAYVRTLEPTTKDYPKRELDFPLNLIVNTIPSEPEHNLAPSNDPVKQGEYIITAAACYDCHTMMNDKGQFNEEMAYAGGMEFKIPTGGTVRSANLTPDKETGIGLWTKDEFVQRFKMYADSAYVPEKISHGQFNTIMPWEYYSQLKVHDLESIYAYLQSLKPIKHEFEKFTPPGS